MWLFRNYNCKNQDLLYAFLYFVVLFQGYFLHTLICFFFFLIVIFLSGFLLMRTQPWNRLLNTSRRCMVSPFNMHIFLAFKWEIRRRQTIYPWRLGEFASCYLLFCSFYFSSNSLWIFMCIYLWQACKIVEGQRYTKRLNEKQITALLKVTCQRPREREHDILQVFANCYVYSLIQLKVLEEN